MIRLTKEEQAQTLADYLPGGRAFGAKNLSTSTIRSLLRGFAEELIKVDDNIAAFRTDIVPDATVLFLDEWEDAVGIPDFCFTGIGTDDERRLRVLVKLANMGLQIDQDFIDLAALFNITITIESGSVHGAFPFIFPITFYPSARAAHHTIIVRYTLPTALTFPYTFPIIFTTPELDLLACMFNKLKPANADVVFEGT